MLFTKSLPVDISKVNFALAWECDPFGSDFVSCLAAMSLLYYIGKQCQAALSKNRKKLRAQNWRALTGVLVLHLWVGVLVL